jgi:vacuolar-type H+-ATPase subunit H
MLEKAVTWIIVLIVVVFDPLAVIMLLGAQMTFAWSKEEKENNWIDDQADDLTEAFNEPHIADEILAQGVTNSNTEDNVPVVDYKFAEDINEPDYPDTTINQTEAPSETPVTALGGDITEQESSDQEIPQPIEQWNAMIAEAEAEAQKELVEKEARKYQILPELVEHNNERTKPDLTEVIEPDDSKKKTYMTKAQDGSIQIKNRS